MKTLRSKFLLAAIALVLLSQLATVVLVLFQSRQEAELTADRTLALGASVLHSYLESRHSQLRTTVEVLADDFGFRQAVATADAETTRSVLRNHAARAGADYAALYDPEGRGISFTQDVQIDLSALALFRLNRDRQPSAVFFEKSGRIYQTIIVPVLAPVRIGWVAMGFRIDDVLAADLSRLTGTGVSFFFDEMGTRRISASTLDAQQRAALVSLVNEGAAQAESPYFLKIETLAAEGVPVLAVLHQPRKEALAAFDDLARRLSLLALLAACLGGVSGIALSKTLTRPVTSLLGAARRIADGDYTSAVGVSTNDEIGQLADTLGIMQDEIAHREAKILHQATHDLLTNVPNRSALQDALSERLAAGRPFGVLMSSFKGIQEINSTLGLELGDQVVQAMASVLEEVDGLSFVAKIADTRFCMIVDSERAEDCLQRAASIRAAFQGRPMLAQVPVTVAASIGVAYFPSHGEHAEDLIRSAWIASMDADARVDGIAEYDSARDRERARRMQIVGDLANVVETDQLSLHYQPKFCAAAGRVTTVEGLLRWAHPQLGFIPPDEFIALAESSNNINRLTDWVLEHAVSQAASWSRKGLGLAVALNVSRRDLADTAFATRIIKLLDRHGLASDQLELEVTETDVVDDTGGLIDSLRILRSLGVRIAIDDFGTGFSSLSQLKQLPVQILKIDKSFVMEMMDSADDKLIVHRTIELAHGLGLDVVAEGVEDEPCARQLLTWGCDELQGYHFSKPLPSGDLERWMQDTDCGRRLLPPPLQVLAADERFADGIRSYTGRRGL